MYLSNTTLFLAVLGLLLSTITLLILNDNPNWRPTKFIKEWIHSLSQSRPSSDSSTPPRSLSPEKEDPETTSPSTDSNTPPIALPSEKEVLNKSSTSPDYTEVLPPSTREALPLAAQSLPEAQRIKLSGREVNEVKFKKSLIPFTADYRECGPSTCTPMGISLEEVQTLGDFPDYACLSGVPLPDAYKDFDITQAIPRPYRPFRWAYHQTMSISKLEPNWWLELDSTYAVRVAERVALFAKHGPLVLNYLPGSELACKETMEHALQFLCARYPSHFSLTHSPEKGGHIFHNSLLGTRTEIQTVHPLHILLHNIPEDFAIMLRSPTNGQYYLRAALLCSSLGWNVSTKLGLCLSEIHSPIPDYKAKMEFSMDRYFSRMPASRPIQRGSWGLEVDKPLFMPPGDPHEKLRESQDPELELERCHLRVDWQTLRRMPVSGAIVFNFKALFTPVKDFRNEPYIPALVTKILREGKKNMMEYKNTWHVEHKVLPALEAWAKEQEENGVTEKGWEVRTLNETPYFPGWREKWRAQQGFGEEKPAEGGN